MNCLVTKIDNFKVHFIVQFCNVLDEKGYRNSASFVVEWTGQTGGTDRPQFPFSQVTKWQCGSEL